MKLIEKKCRGLWQEIVCNRDRYCQRCYSIPITGHHVFGRIHNGSSFDPDSGLGVCVDCHEWAREHPQEARDLLKEKIGAERYAYLEARSRSIVRLRETDFRRIYIDLRGILEKMKGACQAPSSATLPPSPLPS
jgi:RNase P subunit RPR2